jgi:hypothetical protein
MSLKGGGKTVYLLWQEVLFFGTAAAAQKRGKCAQQIS